MRIRRQHRFQLQRRAAGLSRVDAKALGKDSGENQSRRDAAHPHPVLPQFDRCAASQVNHSGLRARVIDLAPASTQPADADHIDDAAQPFA
jgi:hypothetical protein